MYKSVLCVLVFLFIAGPLKAQRKKTQQAKPQIALISRTAKDSIVLRWVPGDASLLTAGFDNGYSIKRSVFENGKWSKFTELANIKPWEKKEWERKLNQIRDTSTQVYKYLKTGYELLINRKDYLPKDISDLSAIQMAKTQNDLLFLFSILTSCNDRVSADAMGLRWVDNSVSESTVYKYKIELNDKNGAYKVEATEIETDGKPYKSDAASKLNAIENETSISLNWVMAEEPLIGYSLERSEDGGSTFVRLNSDMIMVSDEFDSSNQRIGSLADTAVMMYVPYVYRVIGHTLFADEARVGSVNAMARDRTPVSCLFVPSPEPTGIAQAVIKWELTDKAPDLVGFNIRRDNAVNGSFTTKLNNFPLDPSATEFIDGNYKKDEPNYYKIETIDTAGNVFQSSAVYLILVDSFPPTPPSWASAVIDSNGVVALSLKLNPEKDFMGFRIQKANQADHEFSTFLETYSRNDSLPRKSFDTVFYDTVSLKTLTKNIYYKAYALDFNYNESVPSNIIKVARPDIIPPVSPMIRSIEATETYLQMKIIPSSSSDVKNTKLFRYGPGDSTFVEYKLLNPRDTLYQDTNVATGITYEYVLLAEDSAGLVSDFSMVLSAKTYDNGLRKGVENFKAEYKSDFKMVGLTWDYSFSHCKPDEKVFFSVYRSSPLDSSILESYKTFEYQGNNSYFYDKELVKGKTYHYAIRVITDQGAESLLSETKIVSIVKKED